MRILTEREIYRLTKKKTRPAQIRSLQALNILHRVNAAGDPIVIDADLALNTPTERESSVELNLDVT